MVLDLRLTMKIGCRDDNLSFFKQYRNLRIVNRAIAELLSILLPIYTFLLNKNFFLAG